MSTIKFELDADFRQDMGKGASRRLRHVKKVPAVIYGAGEAAVSLTLDHNKVVTALSHEAFYSHILTLNIAGKSEKVILKDLQRDPARPRILHMDFLRVRADQKLHMHVPFHFIGDKDAPGVKEGGVISHVMSDVEISCLPADLPEYIEVDTSTLALDESIHLSQIKLPKGVEIVALAHDDADHDLTVVSLHMPRIEAEEIETAEEVPATDVPATAQATDDKESKKTN